MYTYEKSRFKSIVRIDPQQLEWLKANKGDLKTVAGFLDVIINAYKEMKWWNLKSNKCPKCSSRLDGSATSDLLHCSNPDCNFKISQEKFAALSAAYVEKYRRRERYEGVDGWARFEE